MHLVLNIFLFFVILNFGWFKDKLTSRKEDKLNDITEKRSLTDLFTIPILLGLSLTIVDNMRIFFLYQILIFILMAVTIYFGRAKLKKYRARK